MEEPGGDYYEKSAEFIIERPGHDTVPDIGNVQMQGFANYGNKTDSYPERNRLTVYNYEHEKTVLGYRAP